MNKPGLKTYVLGHPIVMVLATLGTGYGIYRWTQDSTSWPLTAIFLAGLGASTNASDRVDAYWRWKQAWDGMGDSPNRQPRGSQWLSSLFWAAVALVAIAYIPKLQRPVIIYGFAVVVGVVVLWRLFRRIRRPRKKVTQDVVAIWVGSPALRVLTLKEAFDALPAHCRLVLGGKGPP